MMSRSSHHFYVIAIASGYQAILPRIEQFMEKIGRMLYVLPIVRAMIETDWSRGYIRPLFERVRDRHHQITSCDRRDVEKSRFVGNSGIYLFLPIRKCKGQRTRRGSFSSPQAASN